MMYKGKAFKKEKEKYKLFDAIACMFLIIVFYIALIIIFTDCQKYLTR